ncbi:MAG: cofactor assembly of complex C subunit B [Cyanobacteria bacterium P01_A01_bin.123]
MTSIILSSTFFLTLLLAIGLFFFIRASFKDRTTTLTFESRETESVLIEQLKQYFQRRAYQVAAIEPDNSRINLTGFVRPSVFLAVFLSALAATGILCFDLLIAYTAPGYWIWSLGLLAIAPIAGIIYWQRAGRDESVSFQIQPSSQMTQTGSRLTVTAHRDELIQLRRSLALTSGKSDSGH